jgi:hypothetical protein
MNVSGKFDDGDKWLGMSNGPGEWCVAYHGTKGRNVRAIAEGQLCAGSSEQHGNGVYCSPHITVCENGYTDETVVPTASGAIRCKYAFMCRVNTAAIHQCTEAPCPEARNPQYTLHMTTTNDLWFVNCENLRSQNIRTYGILVKEV